MSSLLKSLALLCMWAGASAESQWCDVASDSTGKYLVAVGYACSKVLISDDFGVTWQYTKAPAQYWGSIYSDSTGQKLIIGPHWTGGNPASTSQMMYSTDRGATWTAGTYNNEVTTSVTLPNKISADSATQHVVTVTESQKLIQSRNGGASWVGVDNVPYNKTAGYNGYASALSASGSYFYASNDVGQIYLSTDAGVTFYKKQEACSTCGGVWKNFVTDSTGKILFANTVNQFYMSTDAGVTMKQINDKLAVGSTIVDIYTDSAAKYAYVLTLDGLYVYTRSTGAFVKNALKMVVNQGVGAYSVSASASGQHIIVSVQPEGLYVSDDFGVTWLNIRGLTSK